MKYVAIKDIVHSVSQTHKFEKDHLKAVNTSDVLGGELFDVPYSETALLKGQFKKTIRFNDILFSEIRPANRRFARVNIKETADYVVSTKLMVLRKFNDNVDLDYFYYCLTNQSFLEMLQRRAENRIGSFPQITFDLLGEYKFPIPTLDEQKRIASVIANIDSKINVNREINRNLEAMARQLYDYWFVQFDFPDENGRPYKSSGGAMKFDKALGIEIPAEWGIDRLNTFITSNNTGDWGYDEDNEHRMPVGCIRGADIIKLNDVPLRYIKKTNTHKLLSPYDIVIEVSGGSPVQATGRCAYITPGVIKRNYGNMTCSNFCHAFRMKTIESSAYFYFTWKTLYDNNIMFNFEGKTSGIKNFMTETFLANKWYVAPDILQKLFFNRISNIFSIIDSNIEEINHLIKQRDELLPLLMNGQVSVMPKEINCDLSHD